MTKKTPLPHQVEDAAFLAQREGTSGNFSGMGSGKTMTDLTAKDMLGPGKHLVVCPPIALNMWRRESEAQLGLDAEIIKTGKSKLPDFRHGTMVMSYDIMLRRAAQLASEGFDTVTCDEGHALKSVTAKRTKAVLGRGGIASSVGYLWDLTGTPVTRHNDDLFGFLCRAAPDLLKERIGKLDMTRFRLRYCVTQRKAFPGMRRPVDVVVGSKNTAELNELLYRAEGCPAIRRELADVWANMPPLTVNLMGVRPEMDGELRRMLAELERKPLSEIEAQLRNAEKDDHISSVRRLLGLSMVHNSGAEIADRIDAGNGPLLVGAWHTDVIDALVQRIRNCAAKDRPISVAVIDGRTSANRKVEIEEQWNEGNIDVVVGQIAAMGVSLNLQKGGNQIITVEEDWSPTVMDQFYARLHRMGQEKPVHVDRFDSGTKLAKAVRRIAASKSRNAAILHAQKED